MRIRDGLLLAALALPACHGKSTTGSDDASTSPTPIPSGTSTPNPATTTYFKDVLPIVENHCLPCHTAGGLSVALDSVATAQAFAPLMVSRTADRSMPPWPPEPACGQDYVGERVLSALEKATIDAWHTGGDQAGNPADAPAATPTPVPTPAADRVLDPGSNFTYQTTDPQDYYYCFPVATNLTSASDLVKAQIYPGNPAIVHHVILYKIANGTVAAGACAGVPSSGSANPAEFQVGWTPGAAALEFPADTGMRLLPTDQIVMQVHYHGPPATNQIDRTKAALWFSPTPVTNLARVIWGGTPVFSIPGNTTAANPYSASANCTVQGNVSLLGLAPHMHTLGYKFNATLNPGASQSCLIDIQKWSFGWQGGYMYSAPKSVPSGSKIRTTCTWTNPNGSSVGFGEGTGQEMCFDFFYMTGWTGSSQYCAN